MIDVVDFLLEKKDKAKATCKGPAEKTETLTTVLEDFIWKLDANSGAGPRAQSSAGASSSSADGAANFA
eukprot:2220642-Pyramimonas_sp.AAC.1